MKYLFLNRRFSECLFIKKDNRLLVTLIEFYFILHIYLGFFPTFIAEYQKFVALIDSSTIPGSLQIKF